MDQETNEISLFSLMNGYAMAYFITIIVGNICVLLYEYVDVETLLVLGNLLISLVGPVMGLCIGCQLGLGYIGVLSTFLAGCIGGTSVYLSAIMAFLGSLIVGIIIKIIEGKTRFDLILLPLIAIVVGVGFQTFCYPYIYRFVIWLCTNINELATGTTMWAGALIAIVCGFLSASPFSLMILLPFLTFSSEAYGAATAGVMCYMFGLAFAGLFYNDLGDTIGVGFGTSMFQFGNLIRNPLILIPLSLSSGICGFLSMNVFNITTTSQAMSLGGCMLAGIFETTTAMGGLWGWVAVLLDYVLLPIALTFIFIFLFIRLGLIRKDHLVIEH